jgi:hypothetical protein
MSRSLASVLKTDSLKPLAQILRSKGRKGDTVLAHISPKEAARLKREGGSGTINPDTGLPEFFGEDSFEYPTFEPSSFEAPTFEAPVNLPTFAQESGYTSPNYYGGEAPGSISGYGSSQGTFASPTGLYYETPYASEFAGGFSESTPASYYDVAGGGLDLGRLFGGGQSTGMVTSPTGVPLPPVRGATAQESADYYTEGGQPAQVQETSEDVAKAQTGEDKGIFGKLGLGDLAKLGIGGIGALMGRQQQQEALKQAQALQAQYAANAAAAAKQQKELAAPLLTPGYSALAQANQGRLTATNQQAFQAMQARLAQSQSRSGGVGAIQTAVAEEAARQQALSTQITQALQLIGPGNALANQAITTNLLGQQGGLQLGINLSNQANQAAMSMYGALAKFVAG